MLEILVQLLVEELGSLLQEEACLLGRAREEVEYMKAELERMTAFLGVADAMEENDPQLRVWVSQVRDVAYDIDDAVNEFIIRFTGHHGNGFDVSLRRMCSFVKNLKSRHQIASKIRRIKSRVHFIAEGHQRYLCKFSIPEQSTGFNFSNRVPYDFRRAVLLPRDADIVGIEKPKKQLVEWLVEGDCRLQCVSVVGMGGLGKTTLVRKAYEDAVVKKHFHHHLWLVVSEFFSLDELLRDMIQQLFAEIRQQVPHSLQTMNTNTMKGIINEFLSERRYIVVTDDVWSIESWEVVKHVLPDNKCGSRLLLTTRSLDMASVSSIETQGNIYTLKPLPEEESWTLFCSKAFQGSTCPPHLEKVSRLILRKCEGLPLAILTLGSVLATKDRNRIDEWDMFHRSLPSEIEVNKRFERMKRLLSLSYHELPYYLKLCFLYLSIFPEDYEIEKMRIIRLWIAEGFLQKKIGMTAEEVAESYLYELVNRNLVQVAMKSNDGRLRTCRIHDLLREIFLSRSREHGIVTMAHRPETLWPQRVRHLAFHDLTETFPTRESFSRLHSFFTFGDIRSKSLPLLSVFLKSRTLRVLDLKGTPLEVIPKEVFNLTNLRYLSMRETKVRLVSKQIGKLRNLETLDLKGTLVTELPKEILQLHHLRHLLLYHYENGCHPHRRFALPTKGYHTNSLFHVINGFRAPYNIGGLLALQKLCHIETDQRSGNDVSMVVKEVGKLTRLRRLGILKLRMKDGMALCSSIEKLTELRSLTVVSSEEDEILDLQSLSSPPQFLQRLYLRGRLQRVPEWIAAVHSLVRVRLGWSKLRSDPLVSFQALPNLVELQLIRAYEGEGLCFYGGGFQRLKIIAFRNLRGLRWVRIEEGAMPQLEKMYICNCALLDEVPSGIEHLRNLQLLDLSSMPGKLITALQNQEAKVAHVSDIIIA